MSFRLVSVILTRKLLEVMSSFYMVNRILLLLKYILFFSPIVR